MQRDYEVLKSGAQAVFCCIMKAGKDVLICLCFGFYVRYSCFVEKKKQKTKTKFRLQMTSVLGVEGEG